MIIFVAETRPMPVKGFISYMIAKHKRDIQKENYIMDCLWAGATGREFRDKQGDPLLPRWYDIIHPPVQESDNESTITKAVIKEQFIKLKQRNSA